MAWQAFIPLAAAAIDAWSQNSANKTNKKLAREQMAFQERMSSTEMQRRVTDLRAAGLNPMLAGLNQQGASSAQGASTRVEPITRNTASTALAVQMQRQQLENMDMQTRLLRAQEANVREDTSLKAVTAVQQAANTQQIDATIQQIAQQYKNLQAQYDISMEDLKNKRLTNTQLEKMQPLLQQAQVIANQLDALKIPEAQVTAQWFSGAFGGGGRAANMMKDVFQLIQMFRSNR